MQYVLHNKKCDHEGPLLLCIPVKFTCVKLICQEANKTSLEISSTLLSNINRNSLSSPQTNLIQS